MKLLPSQAAEVFFMLSNSGLNPTEFSWQEVPSAYAEKLPAQKLVHGPSGFYFLFDRREGYEFPFRSRCSPGKDTIIMSTESSSWANQKETVKQWVSYLKREVETPDVWGQVLQEANAFGDDSEATNTLFTADEKRSIVAAINEIRQYLLTAHKLDPELVESRLEYLLEASNRLGRKDWKAVLMSVVMSMGMDAAISSDSMREIVRFVITALGQIMTHPPLMLP